MASFKLLLLLTIGTLLSTTLATPANIEKRGLWCSADTSDAVVTDWANTTAWKGSMMACLNSMHRLDPAEDRDPNPHPTFSFFKSHAKRFRDPKDCWEQCYSCLAKGINIGRAVTTQCNYQAHWGTLGSTCEMGFDYDTPESLAKAIFWEDGQWTGFRPPQEPAKWIPFQGWQGGISDRVTGVATKE
ncbi:MAG: hypothetical protein Q9209_000133 [Squamulea sp. 1 TL-2023]